MNKELFIINEFLTSTLFAGLATRGAKVYVASVLEKEKNQFKSFLRQNLISYSKEYQAGSVSEEKHLKNIKKFADESSAKFQRILVGGRLRIGIAQKLLNLYLKYLWCLEKIEKPPHCPFDNVVKSKIGRQARHIPSWTKIDTIEDYKELAEVAQKQTGMLNLAEWELNLFNGKILDKL